MTTRVIGSIFPPPPPSPSVNIHPSNVVPYLFGGLAAMLALIALALLILACSYLRHTPNNMHREDDPESLKMEKTGKAPPPLLNETVLVIMAGDLNPSFLGTVMSMSGDDCCSGDDKLEQETENHKEEASSSSSSHD